MASSELKQLERELEAAAVQFSISDHGRTALSTTDPQQASEVSEARVVSAAQSVLAVDKTAPIEELLAESARHPLFDTENRSQWQAFLVRIRRQLKPDRRPPDLKPPEPAGRGSHLPAPVTTPLAESARKQRATGLQRERHQGRLRGALGAIGRLLRPRISRSARPWVAVWSLVLLLTAGLGAVYALTTPFDSNVETDGCEGLGCDLGALGERAPTSSTESAEPTPSSILNAAGETDRRGGITAAAAGVVSTDQSTDTQQTPTSVDTTVPANDPEAAADADATTGADANADAGTDGSNTSATTESPAVDNSSSSTTATTTATRNPPAPVSSQPTTTTAARRSTTTTSTTTTTVAAVVAVPDQAPTTVERTTTTERPTTTTTVAQAVGGGGVACPGGSPTLNLNVSRVDSNDVLNVRLGPGTGFAIIGGLAHNATGIRIYGGSTSGSWVMIQLPGTTVGTPNTCGWVHSAFLAAPGNPT